MTFDWVQLYFLIMLIFGLTASAFMHGKTRSDHNFLIDLVAHLLALPWIGRIFGWW